MARSWLWRPAYWNIFVKNILNINICNGSSLIKPIRTTCCEAFARRREPHWYLRISIISNIKPAEEGKPLFEKYCFHMGIAQLCKRLSGWFGALFSTFARLTEGQGGRGLKLFGQCPYRTNTFQKGASLHLWILQNRIWIQYRLLCHITINNTFPNQPSSSQQHPDCPHVWSWFSPLAPPRSSPASRSRGPHPVQTLKILTSARMIIAKFRLYVRRCCLL